MASLTIDLNADVGEGCAGDAELFPLITSANIACGAHAGDHESMVGSVRLALRHGVAIGAHPGFEDRENFGRREFAVAPAEAARLVVEQTGLLAGIARAEGGLLRHVKLHGALYNMAARDGALARAIVDALASESPRLPVTLVALAGSVLERLGRERGLPVAAEGFADRLYRVDGSLAPRAEKGSVISEPAAAAAQALSIALGRGVTARDGSRVQVRADTLCIHGDSPGAAAIAREVRRVLSQGGVRVAPSGTRRAG